MTTEELSIGYTHRARTREILRGLDLDLYPGQITCLLGPNGSGKSTLIRTISGVQKPLSGTVRLRGRPIHRFSLRQKARELSLVLTSDTAPGNLTVYALVALGRYPYSGWLGTLKREDKAIIQQALDMTDTVRFANTPIGELSDGERQRVIIARALVQDTPLIFFDEPTAHLDLPNRIEIFDLLRNLARDSGKSILLTTHHLDLTLSYADRVWLIQPARELSMGIPEDLLLNGAFSKAFVSHDLLFDVASATFFKPRTYQKAIALTGSGSPYRWTKNALQRSGFKVTDQKEDQKVEIRTEASGPVWILQPQRITCHTIEELLNNL